MKALVCEMCGSQDMVKQDGYYVCQSCDTKYTVEEARKLMVEGTVKIDETQKQQNFFELAQTAYEGNNNASAEEHCDKALAIDPANYQIWLLKGKAVGWQTTLQKMRIAEAMECFNKAIEYAPDTEKESVKSKSFYELLLFARSVLNSCERFYPNEPTYENATHFVNHFREAHTVVLSFIEKYGAVSEQHLSDFYNGVANSFISSANKVHSNFLSQALDPYEATNSGMFTSQTTIKTRCYYSSWQEYALCAHGYFHVLEEALELPQGVKAKQCRSIIQTIENMLNHCVYTREGTSMPVERPKYTAAMNRVLKKAQDKLTILDPNYQVPETPSGGCYVATAVYGSYDCPEVWVLRRFRDDTLAATWYGRAFIRTYYAISPTLVKWFGKTEWFKNLWKPTLDRMVNNFKKQGVHDTPYHDRQW